MNKPLNPEVAWPFPAAFPARPDTTPLPTRDEILIMVDQVIERAAKYITEPTAENMAEARLARRVLEAGLALVYHHANKAKP